MPSILERLFDLCLNTAAAPPGFNLAGADPAPEAAADASLGAESGSPVDSAAASDACSAGDAGGRPEAEVRPAVEHDPGASPKPVAVTDSDPLDLCDVEFLR